jgi:hypothetical protein
MPYICNTASNPTPSRLMLLKRRQCTQLHSYRCCVHPQLTDIQSLRGVVNTPRIIMGCISRAEDGRRRVVGAGMVVMVLYECHALPHVSATAAGLKTECSLAQN